MLTLDLAGALSTPRLGRCKIDADEAETIASGLEGNGGLGFLSYAVISVAVCML